MRDGEAVSTEEQQMRSGGRTCCFTAHVIHVSQQSLCMKPPFQRLWIRWLLSVLTLCVSTFIRCSSNSNLRFIIPSVTEDGEPIRKKSVQRLENPGQIKKARERCYLCRRQVKLVLQEKCCRQPCKPQSTLHKVDDQDCPNIPSQRDALKKQMYPRV